MGMKIFFFWNHHLDHENLRVHSLKLTVRPWKKAETQKERIVFQPSIFRGYVAGRVPPQLPINKALKSYEKPPLYLNEALESLISRGGLALGG